MMEILDNVLIVLVLIVSVLAMENSKRAHRRIERMEKKVNALIETEAQKEQALSVCTWKPWGMTISGTRRYWRGTVCLFKHHCTEMCAIYREILKERRPQWEVETEAKAKATRGKEDKK